MQRSEFEKHYYQSTNKEQKVNSAETRKQQSSSEDEAGLVLQHVFSVDGMNEYTSTQWIIDSGATSHVSSDRTLN